MHVLMSGMLLMLLQHVRAIRAISSVHPAVLCIQHDIRERVSGQTHAHEAETELANAAKPFQGHIFITSV